MDIRKEYKKEDLTVIWKPKRCTHSGVCVKTLPEVYKPAEKPWITLENATVDQIKAQVSKCPSGALTYYLLEDIENDSVANDIPIVDNKDRKRFELKVNGQLAIMEYIDAKDSFYLTHTEVPKELEGKGIASAMVRQVLEIVKEKQKPLAPLCPFVAMYIKRHPEWLDIVSERYNLG